MREICELIRLPEHVLEQALCSRTVEAKQEKVVTALSVAQVSEGTGLEAQSQTPSLCRARCMQTSPSAP